MGVVYKLTDEVVLFVLNKKANEPHLSCRSLVGIVEEKSHIHVSKSSLNLLIKNARLSSSSGRVAKKKNTKFTIPPQKKEQLFLPQEKSIQPAVVEIPKIQTSANKSAAEGSFSLASAIEQLEAVEKIKIPSVQGVTTSGETESPKPFVESSLPSVVISGEKSDKFPELRFLAEAEERPCLGIILLLAEIWDLSWFGLGRYNFFSKLSLDERSILEEFAPMVFAGEENEEDLRQTLMALNGIKKDIAAAHITQVIQKVEASAEWPLAVGIWEKQRNLKLNVALTLANNETLYGMARNSFFARQPDLKFGASFRENMEFVDGFFRQDQPVVLGFFEDADCARVAKNIFCSQSSDFDIKHGAIVDEHSQIFWELKDWPRFARYFILAEPCFEKTVLSAMTRWLNPVTNEQFGFEEITVGPSPEGIRKIAVCFDVGGANRMCFLVSNLPQDWTAQDILERFFSRWPDAGKENFWSTLKIPPQPISMDRNNKENLKSFLWSMLLNTFDGDLRDILPQDVLNLKGRIHKSRGAIKICFDRTLSIREDIKKAAVSFNSRMVKNLAGERVFLNV